MRKVLAAGAGVVMAIVATIALATPARAGAFDGDVNNLIPASSGLTVHIATWGDNGRLRCTLPTRVERCERWWLPAGMSDDALKGSNFDADGFTVAERSFEVQLVAAGVVLARSQVAAGVFVDVNGGHPPVPGNNATCRYIGGRAICQIHV